MCLIYSMLIHSHVSVYLLVSFQFLVKYFEHLHISPCFWKCQILVVVVVTAAVKKTLFELGNSIVSVSIISLVITLRLLQRDKHHSFQVESHEQKYPNFPLLRMSAFTATVRCWLLMPYIVVMVHLKSSGVTYLKKPSFKSMNTHLETLQYFKFQYNNKVYPMDEMNHFSWS